MDESIRIERLIKSREWALKNPERTKAINRRQTCKRYGLTVDEYAKALEKQGYRCAICRTHELEIKGNLSIDHDHDTGKFRGLLCHKCNLALGLLKDLPYVSLMNLCHYVRFAGFKTNDEQWEEMFGNKKGEQ